MQAQTAAQLPQTFQLIQLASALVGGGFLGYLVKYYLDRRMSTVNELMVQKRAIYGETAQALLVFLSAGSQAETDLKRFIDCYAKLWLWASDDVLRSVNAFVDLNQRVAQGAAVGQADLQLAYSKCMLALRGDLRHTKLTGADYRFLRA